MEKATVKAELITYNEDCMGYITYVFSLLDEEDKKRLNSKYLMCVRYPNWDQDTIEIGDKGMLNVLEVMAGIDKYYNGTTMLPYKYSNVQFMKFIPFKEKISQKVILD